MRLVEREYRWVDVFLSYNELKKLLGIDPGLDLKSVETSDSPGHGVRFTFEKGPRPPCNCPETGPNPGGGRWSLEKNETI